MTDFININLFVEFRNRGAVIVVGGDATYPT